MRLREIAVALSIIGLAIVVIILYQRPLVEAPKVEGTAQLTPPVQLVVWIWESAGEGLKLNLEDFQNAYPNIDVEFQYMQNADLYQKFLIAANMGDRVPDIVALETSHAAQMVRVGALLDITEQAKPYWTHMNDFKWLDITENDRIYAMPWDTGPVVMFYRRDVFAQAGLPTDPSEVAKRVRTFADYMEIGQTIHENTDAYLMSESMTRSNARFFENMMWQQGLWYFDEEGRVSLDQPEIVVIAQYFVDLMEKGYVFDTEQWMEEWIQALEDGKIATIVGASWFELNLIHYLDPHGHGKWAVAPMPLWSEDDLYASANDGGSNLAINVNSSYPEEAWTFIDFMLGRESSQLRMMSEGGFFPSLETTYEDDVYNEKLEYFGGQPIRQLFVKAVKQIHPQPYTADYPLANQLMRDAFANIFLSDESVAQVLQQTAEELRARTGRR